MRRLLVFVLSFVAAPVAAQTSSHEVDAFVDVGLGADWDDSRSHPAPGAVCESGFAFGFDSHGGGVELDLGVPQSHINNYPTSRYQYVGPSNPVEQQFHYYQMSEAGRHRSIDVVVLRRRRMAINRTLTVTWLVGGGFVYRPAQATTVLEEMLPDGQLRAVRSTATESTRNYVTAAAGLEVEYRLSPRLSVVPRLRMTVFPSLLDDSGLAPRLLTVRPEIGVRWRQ